MSLLNKTVISFELFPPNTPEGVHNLVKVHQELCQLKPKFFSVTFGAGGSAQTKTRDLVRQLVNNKVGTTPHISCIHMTKERVDEFLAEYARLGVNQLVVVRGDIPATEKEQESKSDFQYANDLVTYIRKTTGDHFHITVAAYPEFHPQAENSLIDLDNFKRKIDAGANSAVTQYFFNSDSYFRFLDCCDQLNITIPIIPGIMPIGDYKKLLRFSELCGAEIPLWLRKRFVPYENDPADSRELGIEIVTKLCERLLEAGIKAFHFYTLNQVNPTAIIINNLRLNPNSDRQSMAKLNAAA